MIVAQALSAPRLLILDSGVGGLSIYQAVRRRLPGLSFIYLFDNVGFPYGNRPREWVVQRVTELVSAVLQRHQVQMVVVGCNTASTVALPLLRANFNLPIVGVVPAIKQAVGITGNGVVGLLATKATVSSQYVDDLIRQFAGHVQVERLGSGRLVEIAEDKLRGRIVQHEAIREVMAPWISGREAPDTIVLGCTHFPLISAELLSFLLPQTRLVDSSVGVARQVDRLFCHLVTEPKVLYLPALKPNNLVYCTRLDRQTVGLVPALENFLLPAPLELPLGC